MGIKKGSKVSIHYKLTVDDQVVDTSEGKDPLVYVHGEGQIIPGLEEELLNLDKGDKKSVTIPPEKAYGHINPAAVQKVPKSNFDNLEELQVGSIVQGMSQDQPFQAVVTEISDTDVSLDLNHPLAGKTLNFDIEIASVE